MASSPDPATAPSLEELRSRLIPTTPDERWDDGELPRAILRLHDHAALGGCELLLRLVCVQRRCLDEARASRTVALREVLLELLPDGLDHPCCEVLRALAGLEPGTAGRSREARQRIAGDRLGTPRFPSAPRTVRRRTKAECWPWLLDRLIELETTERRALGAGSATRRTAVTDQRSVAGVDFDEGLWATVSPEACSVRRPERSSSHIALESPATTLVPGRTGVEAVMQGFRDADRQVGGGYIYGAVIGYLTREVAPQVFKTTSYACAAAAALTEMAGWMAHDAGHDELAQRHFDRARRLASLTDDVELTAHVHASMSHLAQHASRPYEALRLAQAGASIVTQEHGSATAARLDAMQARALAALGRGSDCGRMLLSAERTLDRQPPQPPSSWVSPFDHASLAAEASACMEELRHLAAARRHSERVISLRDSNHVRSRVLSQLRLASVLVTAGEIDHACTVAHDALASSGQLASHRVSQLLCSLHAKLVPHATARGVGDAVEAVSAALDARVPAHLLIAGGLDAER